VARVKTPAPPPAGGSLADFDVRIAWRLDDPQIEADALDFWKRLGRLPAGIRPEDRAKELIAVAYKDGRIVSVTSAELRWIAELRARFAVGRAATDPEHRRSGAQLALAVPTRETLERWAIDHPEEKLAGRIGYLDQNEWGDDLIKTPVWPTSRLMLAGYAADGRQVRVQWFEHFRFD
jgi:hypothetical protein